MILLKVCRQTTCITGFIKTINHNLKWCRKDDVFIYNKIHTSSAVNILNHDRDDKQKVDTKFCQRAKSFSVAAKIVENAPVKFKPYMKLMRIDRPIGKCIKGKKKKMI